MGEGQNLPREEQECLRQSPCPDRTVEPSSLSAFATGRRRDARQFTCSAEKQNHRAQGGIAIVVDLFHVPRACRGGDEQAGEVQQREAENCVPGEGVADAAVEGIGLVFVEAQDVGERLRAGKLSAQGGEACPCQYSEEPGQVSRSESAREQEERQRSGR